MTLNETGGERYSVLVFPSARDVANQLRETKGEELGDYTVTFNHAEKRFEFKTEVADLLCRVVISDEHQKVIEKFESRIRQIHGSDIITSGIDGRL